MLSLPFLTSGNTIHPVARMIQLSGLPDDAHRLPGILVPEIAIDRQESIRDWCPQGLVG
jgi:hypothetical protein